MATNRSSRSCWHAEAQVNAVDGSGSTPMHYAALDGHKAVAELLLAKGANLKRSVHWTDRRDRQRHDAVAPGSAKKSVSPSPNGYARTRPTSTSRLPGAGQHCTNAADKNDADSWPARSIRGRSRGRRFGWCHPLYVAVEGTRLGAAEALLAGGGIFRMSLQDPTGFRRCTRRFGNRSFEMVELLLRYQANLESVAEGQTPIVVRDLFLPNSSIARLCSRRRHPNVRHRSYNNLFSAALCRMNNSKSWSNFCWSTAQRSTP